MKNIFKIHPLTYLVLVSVLLCGYFNYFLIISFILIIHDLGHLIMFKIFHYQIKEIMILPFGSLIKSNIGANAKTSELILISSAGIIMQLLLYLVIPFWFKELDYQIFLTYNQLIIFFNLLPIIPLDGSKIFMGILELLISYKQALIIINMVSLLGIIFLVFFIGDLNAWLIIFFLGYKTYEMMVNHEHCFNYFLLTRYLYPQHYQQIKYVKKIKAIFKNKYNFINNKGETKVLALYFK